MILIPIVNKMIISARRGAAIDSAYGYVKAVEYYRLNLVETDNEEDDVDTLNPLVKAEGKLPTAGYVIYTKRGLNVDVAHLCINGYSVLYMDGKASIAQDESFCEFVPSFVEPEGEYIRELCEGTTTYDSTRIYKVKTAEDLACFSQIINNDTYFASANVAVVADIDIADQKSYFYKANHTNATMYGDINGDGTTSDLKTELTTEKGFNPIGRSNTNNKYFKGILDGNDFTISNLMISRSSEDYVGLFGYNGGTIKKINFDNIKVSGKNYVGGIVGINYGTIRENHVNVEVEGTGESLGGISGVNSNLIRDNWVTAKVTGSSNSVNLGGISGLINSTNSLITENVIEKAEIYGKYKIGGIVGQKDYGTVKNILIREAIVTSSLTSWGGSAVGEVYSYGSGTIEGIIVEKGSAYSTFGSITCTNCYYLETFTPQYHQDYKYRLGTKNVSGYENALDTWIGGDNDNSGYYFRQADDGKFYLVKTSDYPITFNLEGAGTEANPYLIKTTDDWNNATIKANIVGVHFKIVNDLDFTNKTFYKMGSIYNKFAGVIDGNNKTISGIFLDGGAFSGLIGYAESTAAVSNLTLDGITIDKGCYYEGILVGYNLSSDITNVKIKNSNVTNSYYAGLVAGHNTGTLLGTEIVITNSNVTGDGYNGLIAGYSTGTIKDFTVTGTVLGTGSYKGGLVGYNTGTIKENHVNVEVEGTGESLGGISGVNCNLIRDNWVTAKVTGSSNSVNLGGISGLINSTNSLITENVIEKAEIYGKYKIGGIVGQKDYGTVKNILVREAIVTSSLTSWGGSAVGEVYSYGSGTIEGIIVEKGSAYSTFGSITCTNCYYLETFTPQYHQDTKISSSYYNNLTKYDEVLETAYDGDLDNSGYFFGYNTNGIIDLVKQNYEPDVTPCTSNCPTDDELETVVSTGTGTCEGDGADTTPPTCTFIRSYPLSNGIAAEFTCADNSGAPEVASLFNSTTNQVYSYSDILARGSIKTGKVSGNTRSINSHWTTSYALNQPQVGLCYYYQYGAKDSCGNWTTYTTKYCYYGFTGSGYTTGSE